MDKISVKNLPPKFIANIVGLHGTDGEKWLTNLPLTIEEICRKRNLQIEKVFANLSFNFVAACASETGEKSVLKICLPEDDAPLIYENKALKVFDGQGAVKVLDFDEEHCAMFIERAIAGKTLYEVCGEDFEKGVEITINVLKKLPRKVSNKSDFINLEDWLNGLNRAVKTNFAPEKVARAQKFFTELSVPFEQKILLHGDVHFDNILSARREPFLLIDPKGLLGEIGYELAVFLNDLANWTEHLENRQEILAKSIEKFAQNFNLAPQDLRKWCYAFAVLSAWWMMEDFGKEFQQTLDLADIWGV